MTFVGFFRQIMKKMIGLSGWETRTEISLSNRFIGLRIRKEKINKRGVEKCGTTKFTKDKTKLFEKLPTKVTALSKI